MYPVQHVQSFGIIMRHGNDAMTRQQYTGGGYLYTCSYRIDRQIQKQTQDIVRLVSYRYDRGQCGHILSFLACLDFAAFPVRIDCSSYYR